MRLPGSDRRPAALVEGAGFCTWPVTSARNPAWRLSVPSSPEGPSHVNQTVPGGQSLSSADSQLAQKRDTLIGQVRSRAKHHHLVGTITIASAAFVLVIALCLTYRWVRAPLSGLPDVDKPGA